MIAIIPQSSSFAAFWAFLCSANRAGILIALLAAAQAVLPNTTTHAATAAHSPQEGIIVLRAGQVLHGKIFREGDRYHVIMPHGEILVRTVEVEAFCKTLDEAYRLKRSLLHVGNVYGHIALAEWCLRNDLLDAAAAELADATAADPQNPMIAHLQRRLQAALNPLKLPKQPDSSTHTMPSRGELDKLSRAMPSGGMETFTSTIQPLLLNSCSTHECHGPNAASKFRLLRTHPGRAPSRRLTQQNLYAVMQWIDCENPTASPLLTLPIKPHGPKRSVLFNEQNVAQYRELVNWVNRVVLDQKMQNLQRPATVGHRPGAGRKGVLAKPAEVRHASHNAPVADSAKQPAASKGVNRAVYETPLPDEKDGGNRTPSAEAAPEPVDPFDPAIFNQRYLPDE